MACRGRRSSFTLLVSSFAISNTSVLGTSVPCESEIHGTAGRHACGGAEPEAINCAVFSEGEVGTA